MNGEKPLIYWKVINLNGHNLISNRFAAPGKIISVKYGKELISCGVLIVIPPEAGNTKLFKPAFIGCPDVCTIPLDNTKHFSIK